MTNPDHYKIDPNSRLDSSKRSPFGPITRPDKDFKDFLNIKKGEDEKEDKPHFAKKKGKFEDELLASNASSGTPADQPSLSLFDLSAHTGKEEQDDGSMAPSNSLATPVSATGALSSSKQGDDAMMSLSDSQQPPPQSSPFQLASQTTTPRKVAVDENGMVVNPSDSRAATSLARSKKGENSEFVEEKPDLSTITPQPTLRVQEQITPIVQTETTQPAPLDKPTLQQIIDQIVEKIYVLKEDGRSDTTIILKNPPLLEGVKVTLSAYESARGQYNITFENLTQMAKDVLDFQVNRDALKLALDNKGIVVQMMTTTTSNDLSPIIAWSGNQQGQGEDQQGFGEDNKQKKQQQESDEKA